jgi:hypothetical protein
MAGGGNTGGGAGGTPAAPPNPFQYSPQGNMTGMYGTQGNISGSDINNLVQRNMGNLGYTVNALNQAGIGQPDVAAMAGIQPTGVYTYLNRPSQYTDQFFQPIYQPRYQSYSASPYSTFGVASYGTSPMMNQDIMARGMQTVPYYSFGGGNLDMFGLPSVMTPFTYYPQQTGLGQNFSLRNAPPPGGGGGGVSPPGGGGGGGGGPGGPGYDDIVAFGGSGSGFAPTPTPYFGDYTTPAARAPIVTRSAQARGAPAVMRRAEGGIADLLKK